LAEKADQRLGEAVLWQLRAVDERAQREEGTPSIYRD